jgi:surface protein
MIENNQIYLIVFAVLLVIILIINLCRNKKESFQNKSSSEIKKSSSNTNMNSSTLQSITNNKDNPSVTQTPDNELKTKILLWKNNKIKCIEKYGEISTWDTSNVTNMNMLFQNYKNFNDDISEWDVSNVKYMNFMFHNCRKFNKPLNKWKVNNVEGFSRMFKGCSNFNQPLNKWDVSNAIYMIEMFSGADIFDKDISDWDLSNIKNCFLIFEGCPIPNKNKPKLLNDCGRGKQESDVYDTYILEEVYNEYEVEVEDEYNKYKDNEYEVEVEDEYNKYKDNEYEVEDEYNKYKDNENNEDNEDNESDIIENESDILENESDILENEYKDNEYEEIIDCTIIIKKNMSFKKYLSKIISDRDIYLKTITLINKNHTNKSSTNSILHQIINTTSNVFTFIKDNSSIFSNTINNCQDYKKKVENKNTTDINKYILRLNKFFFYMTFYNLTPDTEFKKKLLININKLWNKLRRMSINNKISETVQIKESMSINNKISKEVENEEEEEVDNEKVQIKESDITIENIGNLNKNNIISKYILKLKNNPDLLQNLEQHEKNEFKYEIIQDFFKDNSKFNNNVTVELLPIFSKVIDKEDLNIYFKILNDIYNNSYTDFFFFINNFLSLVNMNSSFINIEKYINYENFSATSSLSKTISQKIKEPEVKNKIIGNLCSNNKVYDDTNEQKVFKIQADKLKKKK